MTLFDQISEDIKSAMKARDKVRLETLRNYCCPLNLRIGHITPSNR